MIHVAGIDPSTGLPVEHWIAGGRYVEGPLADPVELSGWVLPGFVDAHCHVGYSPTGPVDLAAAEDQARLNLAAGVTTIRDCGSPTDTSALVGRPDLPILIRAGRHLGRPRRYIRGLGLELGDPAELPAEVARQVAFGGGWIKLVGDWIDRETGDLEPLWPEDVLVDAIQVAHDGGARVTAHVFGEDAIPGLLAAGIDCLEHGTGLNTDSIDQMVRGQVHLVPTLINIANFPSFADAAGRFPKYAQHMRDLHRRSGDTFRAAIDAGVSVHAGTDAGGFIEHGRIVDEVLALIGLGMSAAAALHAASWQAQRWLGRPDPAIGSEADLVVYPTDVAAEPAGLRNPLAVIRGGQIR